MFSAVHLHLALNHSPLYAEMFAFFLLLAGFIRRNRTLVTTGFVVCVLAALGAIAAFTTGDGAAQYLKRANLPGVDISAVREHDLAAGYGLTTACVTGSLAIAALIWGQMGTRPRWTEVVIMLALLFSLSVVIRVSLLGGRIHHQEVRAGVPG